MSTATFDGQTHTLTIRNKAGMVVATGKANNRTANAATLHYVPTGSYTVLDRSAAYLHGPAQDALNGEYGTFGIIRFNVAKHGGIGIHAGRQSTPDLTPKRAVGPDHVTMGCIRTDEATMKALTDLMKVDPLESVVVVNNNQRQP